MQAFKKIFGQYNRIVLGMIHVRALPGSPRHSLTFDEISNKACEEAKIYSKHGLSGIVLENMHDVPYEKEIEQKPHTVAFMTAIATKVRQQFPHLPIGIQILSGANQQALAVAVAANLNFIRCEGYVFGHIGDEGYIDSCAASLLRYRKYLNADNILIFTDVKKKHSSHAITDDITTCDVSKAAEMFLSDGIIVTGQSTGISPDENLVQG
ncbi:DgyrCDS6064 [Dimorphilus gyrociliatus]|uniref:DgyrCDS6064 n=1 Tax=Dimorphilus gyrociliatus TaxID=2664684 RepID=A0A7I8VLV3_9ANNE|nr:DgyrCDS6064 [Dimorphilus gyrociliatus]